MNTLQWIWGIILLMLLVGLTGNYGMGKSTVLPMFRKLGVITLDSDRIVESLLMEKDVLKKIQELLGNKVFQENGNLNKEKVGDVIFQNDVSRQSLEDILHPLVFKRIQDFLNTLDEDNNIVMVEIPLLFERGYENRFHKTITVYTKEEIALNRLEQKGVTREKALLRLKAQLPIDEKIKRSDFVINNNVTIEEAMTQVETIYKKLLEEADEWRLSRVLKH
jgi:dephospho-CoA kinase